MSRYAFYEVCVDATGSFSRVRNITGNAHLEHKDTADVKGDAELRQRERDKHPPEDREVNSSIVGPQL